MRLKEFQERKMKIKRNKNEHEATAISTRLKCQERCVFVGVLVTRLSEIFASPRNRSAHTTEDASVKASTTVQLQ